MNNSIPSLGARECAVPDFTRGLTARTGQDPERGMVALEGVPLPAPPAAAECVFTLRMSGNSMRGAGIRDGDTVVLEARAPQDGDIVAAVLGGETVLRRYVANRGPGFLRAEHPRSPELIPALGVEIRGVMRVSIVKGNARALPAEEQGEEPEDGIWRRGDRGASRQYMLTPEGRAFLKNWKPQAERGKPQKNPRRAMPVPEGLSPADPPSAVARRHGVSHTTAVRWLAAVGRKPLRGRPGGRKGDFQKTEAGV